MKFKLISFFIAISMFISCNENVIDNAQKIDIEKSTDEELSQVFKVSNVLQLETSEESMIAGIDKLIIEDSMVFVSDIRTSSIVLFNTEGLFQKRIKKRGKARGEYMRLSDFNITDNKIEILNNERRSLMYYNISDGVFVNEVAFSGEAPKFFNKYIELLNGYVCYTKRFNAAYFSGMNIFHVYDHEQNFVSKFGSAGEAIVELLPIETNTFTQIDNQTILYSNPLLLDLYHVTMDGEKKIYQLDFGDDFLDIDAINTMFDNPKNIDVKEVIDYMKSQEKISFLDAIFENSKYLVGGYSVESHAIKQHGFFIYSKKTKSVKRVDHIQDDLNCGFNNTAILRLLKDDKIFFSMDAVNVNQDLANNNPIIFEFEILPF